MRGWSNRKFASRLPGDGELKAITGGTARIDELSDYSPCVGNSAMNESVTRTGAPTEWGWRVEFLGNQLDLVGGSRHLARSKSGRRMNSGIHHSNCRAK